VKPLDPGAERAAEIANEFVAQARRILADEGPQNDLLLRGWGMLPDPPIEPFEQRYGLKAAAVATYPMYRGIARVVGMDVLDTGKGFQDEIQTVREHWDEYDFFYVHRKETDSAGHAGDFQSKVQELEDCDPLLQDLVEMEPAVLVITGDHATPTALKEHSFHEVPALFYGELVTPDRTEQFDEVQAMNGGVGHIHGTSIMPLLLAYAQRLLKFKS
jgi:2,3-bisphosphoglycerate-independent phosphoglycerate mutase